MPHKTPSSTLPYQPTPAHDLDGEEEVVVAATAALAVVVAEEEDLVDGLEVYLIFQGRLLEAVDVECD